MRSLETGKETTLACGALLLASLTAALNNSPSEATSLSVVDRDLSSLTLPPPGEETSDHEPSFPDFSVNKIFDRDPSTLSDAKDKLANVLLLGDWFVPCSAEAFRLCADALSEDFNVCAESLWFSQVDFQGTAEAFRKPTLFYHIYALADPDKQGEFKYFKTELFYFEQPSGRTAREDVAIDQAVKGAGLSISRRQISVDSAVSLMNDPNGILLADECGEIPVEKNPRYTYVCDSEVPFGYERYSVSFDRDGKMVGEIGPYTSKQERQLEDESRIWDAGMKLKEADRIYRLFK